MKHTNSLTVGNVTITLHRTLRLPEDGKTHALPPSLGSFPVRAVADYLDKVPASWREHGGVFMPLYQREAMWMGFHVDGATTLPTKHAAIKVAAGKVNAVSGKAWTDKLEKPEDAVIGGKDPLQDYMVVPGQPWLDGFNTGDSVVRQFVAMPLGMGYTVEKQVTGKEDVGGIQVAVYPAKIGAIPEARFTGYPGAITTGSLKEYKTSGPVLYAGGAIHDGSASANLFPMNEDCYIPTRSATSTLLSAKSMPKGAEMGLAAGGKMTQKIYADPHGIDAWNQDEPHKLFIHIVNSQMWQEITGEAAPESPVSAHTYTAHGLPWFSIYDENVQAVQGSGTLANVKPVSEIDKDKDITGQQNDEPLDESKNVKSVNPLASKLEKFIKLGEKLIQDGKW